MARYGQYKGKAILNGHRPLLTDAYLKGAQVQTLVGEKSISYPGARPLHQCVNGSYGHRVRVTTRVAKSQ